MRCTARNFNGYRCNHINVQYRVWRWIDWENDDGSRDGFYPLCGRHYNNIGDWRIEDDGYITRFRNRTSQYWQIWNPKRNHVLMSDETWELVKSFKIKKRKRAPDAPRKEHYYWRINQDNDPWGLYDAFPKLGTLYVMTHKHGRCACGEPIGRAIAHVCPRTGEMLSLIHI